MRKRFTKIICTTIAAISALSLAVLPACKTEWKGVSGVKDSATKAVEGTNGGFLVETADYVYFINGKADATDSNEFGSVLKGSVQRISKTDIAANNYSDTQTVVPSVIYSGSYGAGLYIYDGYLYYTTPGTQKTIEGDTLNTRLDFKRTKLDGTGTTDGRIWQSENNSVDYRYVQVDGTVYIMYAISENLYGESKTNIHSVNCKTGKNTVIAYGVDSYKFDTKDPENPCAYYTMSVPLMEGDSTKMSYNQLYRVRADVSTSPREYDFSGVSNYHYINYGDYVFDGIGTIDNDSRVSQYNYGYWKNETYSDLKNQGYAYALKSYKNGELLYTRKDGSTDSEKLYRLADGKLDADGDGKVDASWNAVKANDSEWQINNNTTEYEFITIGGKLYAFTVGSGGISKREVIVDGNGQPTGNLSDWVINIPDTSSAAEILAIKEEGGRLNMYYTATGGTGYSVNRVAIDGTNDDYTMLPADQEDEGTLAYRSVKVLDVGVCSSWYMPEFVGNKLFFASETKGMSNFNYIMVCDLSGANGIMTNKELKAYNERFTAVSEKIDEYSVKKNSDGNETYPKLADALKYYFSSRDKDYFAELIDALAKEDNYSYGKTDQFENVATPQQVYKDFAEVTGDWATDKDGNAYLSKTINGETVYSNTRDYYYTLVGRMTKKDAKGLIEVLRGDLVAYPVKEEVTWFESLTNAEKGGFIFGMVECGMIVLGGAICVVAYLVSRKKNRGEGSDKGIKVDITDDKSVDVYGE